MIEVALNYTVKLPVEPMLFRLLRVGKLVRAVRMVAMTSVLASLQLLVKCLAASRDMLWWSFCLLAFVQSSGECADKKHVDLAVQCNLWGTPLDSSNFLGA